MSDDDRAAKAARAKALVRLSLLKRSTTNLSFIQLNKKRQQKKPGPVSNTGAGAGASVTPTPGSPLVRAISPPLTDSSEDAKVDVMEMWVSNMSSHAIFN